MTTDHSSGEQAGHATVTGAVFNRLALSATTHCLIGCGTGEQLSSSAAGGHVSLLRLPRLPAPPS